MAAEAKDHLSSEDDRELRAKRKRGAVMVFMLGWLFFPFFVILIRELHRPWHQVGVIVMFAFIGVFIWAVVRVVRNF
jgi:hypothetical protein